MFVFYSKLWTVKEKFSKIITWSFLFYFTLFVFFIILLSPSSPTFIWIYRWVSINPNNLYLWTHGVEPHVHSLKSFKYFFQVFFFFSYVLVTRVWRRATLPHSNSLYCPSWRRFSPYPLGTCLSGYSQNLRQEVENFLAGCTIHHSVDTGKQIRIFRSSYLFISSSTILICLNVFQ